MPYRAIASGSQELFPAVERVGIGVEFGLCAFAHLDGAGEAFLSANRATDAVFGVCDGAIVFPDEAEVRAAGAVSAFRAQIHVDFGESFDGRKRHEVGEAVFAASDEVVDRFDAALCHEVGETFGEFFDDADAVFHGDGAELDVDGAKGEEVCGIAVVHGSAVARDGDAGIAHRVERAVGDGGDAVAAHADEDAFIPCVLFAVEVLAEGERWERIGERDAGFFVGVAVEDFFDGLEDDGDRGDGSGEFEEFGDFGVGDFHDPVDNFRGERGVLRNDIALGSVAALRARKRVFDGHGAGLFEFFGVRLPSGAVVFVVSGHGATG